MKFWSVIVIGVICLVPASLKADTRYDIFDYVPETIEEVKAPYLAQQLDCSSGTCVQVVQSEVKNGVATCGTNEVYSTAVPTVTYAETFSNGDMYINNVGPVRRFFQRLRQNRMSRIRNRGSRLRNLFCR